MNVATKRQPVIAASQIAVSTFAGSLSGNSAIDRDIRDFLTGKNNGEELLHALYDDVLDEPVPDHLLAILRG